MRIAHVLETTDPRSGGPAVGVPSLASAMAAEAGQQVSLICCQAEPATGSPISPPPGSEKVRVVNLSRPLATWSGQSLGNHLRNMQFVQLHGVWRPLLATAARICTRHSIAYSITPHGMLSPWSLEQKKWKKRLALLAVWRRILDEAAFLHCLNSTEAELIRPLGLRSPVVLAPNGVFLEEYAQMPPGRFADRHPRLAGRRFILFMGRLHYKKGLDYLLEAFRVVVSRHPDVDLVIAGPDDGEEAGVRRLVRNYRLEDRVHLVGAIYGSAKREALADATLFCLPSRDEGFSVAITEAMACRVPVVISENCHFPEVEAAGAGIVCSLSAQAIGDGLTALLSDENLRLKSAAAAADLVRNNYEWHGIARRLVEACVRYGKQTDAPQVFAI
jgi:glycosyltransferase involved in cell wall biosynthesis